MFEEIIFDYSGRDFLDRLSLAIPNKDYSLSVTLRPDFDSIIRLAEMKSGLVISSPILEIQKDIDKENLARDQVIELTALTAFEEFNVYPFWSLKFNYKYGGKPELSYEGPLSDESNRNFRPSLFTKGKKWFGIHLICDNLGDKTGEIKKSVYDFTSEGYTVSSLNIRKKPVERGEYLEDRGHLYSRNRAIHIVSERDGTQLEDLVRKLSE